MLRFHFTPVYIDHIRHGLKRIERNPDRQRNMQQTQTAAKNTVDRRNQEICIFKEAQDQQVSCDSYRQKPSRRPLFNSKRKEIIEQDGKYHHKNILRFSPAVKEQTGCQQNPVPCRNKPCRNQKIRKKRHCQKCQ